MRSSGCALALCLLALVAVSTAVPIGFPSLPDVEKKLHDEFVAWKTKFHKAYDGLEHLHRFVVWRDNLARIAAHNEAFHKGEETFWMGVNQFADMKTEEFKAMQGFKDHKKLGSPPPPPPPPPRGGGARLHEQVVGLVVKAPLADGEVGPAVLDLLDHLHKVLLLLLVQRLELLGRVHRDRVLGLGLGGLEGAREDAHLGVLDVLAHAGVRDLLVKHDPVDELRVLHLPPGAPLHLDQVEVDVLAVEVGDGHDGLDGDVGHVVEAARDNLGRQRGARHLHQGRDVLLVELDLVRDRVQVVARDLAGRLEPV
mmetsp:Transcript_8705/g.21477  ORF Transcript_8705/g.21477 Transcript_8705/m.21477 type:complete len:311 (+) Transcript_8705:48-980(+)